MLLARWRHLAFHDLNLLLLLLVWGLGPVALHVDIVVILFAISFLKVMVESFAQRKLLRSTAFSLSRCQLLLKSFSGYHEIHVGLEVFLGARATQLMILSEYELFRDEHGFIDLAVSKRARISAAGASCAFRRDQMHARRLRQLHLGVVEAHALLW